MLLLTSTSDKVQLLTGAAVTSIEVHASWVDNNAGTITPGRQNTIITTATTTDIVPAPGAGVQRNVRSIYITNTSAATSSQVTVLHTDGTNVSDIYGVAMLGGENVCYREDGSWVHRDWNGAEYAQTQPPDFFMNGYSINGALSESIPRFLAGVNAAVLTSGTMFLQAIYLKAGMKVSNISFASQTTAAGTPTNYWFALYNSSLTSLLGQTANQTTTAWAATTVKTLPLTAAYTVPTNGIYYVGIMMAATTAVSLAGVTAATSASGLRTAAPILSGNSTSTGLTTTVPASTTLTTAATQAVWCAVS